MDNINKFEDFLDRMQGLLDKAKKQGHIIVRVEDLENTFPELQESEDEKIRKELIKEINGLWENDSATWPSSLEKKNKYIAWLEKQGEKKPFDYENANIQQKDFAPQEDAPRYSIGDVLYDKSCTTLNKDAQPNYEIVDIRNGLYICDKGYIPISQQDEYELVAKKIEQKPTNKEMKELLRTEYEKGRADAIAEIQVAWSEEDEEYLRRAINATKDAYPMTTKWLKSLKDRYTWKPSEKQLNELHKVITNTGFNPYVIKSLYDDLKKLRGE